MSLVTLSIIVGAIKFPWGYFGWTNLVPSKTSFAPYFYAVPTNFNILSFNYGYATGLKSIPG